MTAPKPAPTMFSVFDGQTCLGHILARGKLYEAFDRADRSPGTFPTAKQAAGALLVKEGG